ncbi:MULTISPECIES: alanine racemase [unclassified Rhizobium]|uniref:alanine racemase n=1 Tax=unclassified Rhizobium TaxID=2613769 RepID=UPI0007EBC4A2|nr:MULTISPECIES: alanine racemase [unclassified Rhizobium]ANM13085.1 alanine racemase domain-containing protein [Rhizobium sp. N324]ANM19483.1 alanine racemase domain-containing protein [Rhizobium sp. N541]ANM25868.1 alanine racemase domain-containing protein [Rhizobium sp. N941]OYD01546.1 alanine racemase domain-containing protein [Rhizobium sp. N4311]
MSDLQTATENVLIDERVRGFPPGHPPLPLVAIGTRGWRPYDGRMALPLISLDRQAFAGNVELMMAYVKSNRAEIAPHAKTPMSTALADMLLSAGAWGATVADIRQTAVLLKAGQRRLILANEIGGVAAACRLAALLGHYPDAELHVFVDSTALVEALAFAWQERADLPPLGLLVEFGAGRAGLRSAEAAAGILDAILAVETPALRLSGIAAYEGAAATADPEETMLRIDALMAMTSDFLPKIRVRIGRERPLLVTSGGSVFFDIVVARLSAVVAADPACRLVLRSGAIFFHDHGVYERGLAGLDARGGFRIGGEIVSAAAAFRPTLRVWAEVLSRPEPGLAIAGMGMRDVAMDQDLPRPLALYRNGVHLADLDGARVFRLNDQHAFMALADDSDVAVGDVIEFGISHPCTCLDRHAILYGLDPDHSVTAAYFTSFG